MHEPEVPAPGTGEITCETAPLIGPPPRFCALCGTAGRGWTAAGAQVAGPEHRCDACYRPLLAGSLHCPDCGRRVMHPDTATWRAHHAGAGRLCARAGGGPSPAGTDPLTEEPAGFEHLRAAGAIFGSLLGLVLLNYAWVFHTQDDSTMADFVFGTLFASLVIVWAWRERAWLAPLCRWPEFDRTGILVMLTTPLLTLAAVRGQTYVADWIHLPVVNYLKGFERDGYGVGTALVFVAVLPAIFEEIAFRGLILARLQRVMSAPQALLVNAVMFAVLHFNIIGFVIFLAPLAYLNGWLTLRTRSLLPAIVIHFLHNAGVLAGEYFGL